ncbi:hypothetical protein [Rarobacter incanus]|uniref:Uncharacterized protein n=1 Tax=Rarobacter incanus TaxID=153494 RepID=A0A542SNT3_9MICO|nr:hypothetical protein [Rarobacter incanus]TQK76294.1 hypothetical protein FB389_0957 [Rarobacter incanus]
MAYNPPFKTIINEAAEGKNAKREHSTSSDVACSRKDVWVDVGGLKLSVWSRIERLSLAWEQARTATVTEDGLPLFTELDFVTNPRRRARTPLTTQEVDPIRTALLDCANVALTTDQFQDSQTVAGRKAS